MNLFVYPYNSASESAKLLADKLGALRIKLANSTYQHNPATNLVVNWGNSNCPLQGNVLNPGTLIKDTVDKLKFFRLMTRSGMAGYLPRYFTHTDDIPDDAFPVLCRTTTTGCDGAGIVVATQRSELVPANLYTQLVADAQEYRVTLFRGEVTDVQTKLPRSGVTAHPIIHTYANGWGFRRENVSAVIEGKIIEAARAALRVSQLDFGGIDVLYANGKAYVLEINTAMGLEGGALNRFAEAVQRYAATLATPVPPEPAKTLEDAFPGSLDRVEEFIVAAMRNRDWLAVARAALAQAA